MITWCNDFVKILCYIIDYNYLSGVTRTGSEKGNKTNVPNPTLEILSPLFPRLRYRSPGTGAAWRHKGTWTNPGTAGESESSFSFRPIGWIDVDVIDVACCCWMVWVFVGKSSMNSKLAIGARYLSRAGFQQNESIKNHINRCLMTVVIAAYRWHSFRIHSFLLFSNPSIALKCLSCKKNTEEMTSVKHLQWTLERSLPWQFSCAKTNMAIYTYDWLQSNSLPLD